MISKTTSCKVDIDSALDGVKRRVTRIIEREENSIYQAAISAIVRRAICDRNMPLDLLAVIGGTDQGWAISFSNISMMGFGEARYGLIPLMEATTDFDEIIKKVDLALDRIQASIVRPLDKPAYIMWSGLQHPVGYHVSAL